MTAPTSSIHYLAGLAATDDERRAVVREGLGPEPDSGSLAWYYWHSANLFARGVTPHQVLDRRPAPDVAREAARASGRIQSGPQGRRLQAVPASPAA